MTVPRTACTDTHCVTCADEGIVMRVAGPGTEPGLMACVGADGQASDVDTSLAEPVAAGDAILVHAGVALLRLNPDVAGPG